MLSDIISTFKHCLRRLFNIVAALRNSGLSYSQKKNRTPEMFAGIRKYRSPMMPELGYGQFLLQELEYIELT